MAAHNLDRLKAIAGDCHAPDQAQLRPLIDSILARHEWASGNSPVVGIVYYGSCFRHSDPTNGLVDFYVVVDSFRAAGIGRAASIAGLLLPPNVYYLTVDGPNGPLSCKYALITALQLKQGVSTWFSSNIWGRFAQPLAIVHARDAEAWNQIHTACGQAVVTLLNRALPALGTGRATPERWFERALALSFSSEIRVEPSHRPREFIGTRADEYARRFQAARSLVSYQIIDNGDGEMIAEISQIKTCMSRLSWLVRVVHGRIVSGLRLVKSCFTSEGAIDYGAWKLARHTGYYPQINERVRRHPLIFGWPIFWQALRAVRRQKQPRDRVD